MKAHYGGGAKIVLTLQFILRVPSLNFNHVIIMKKFHNVFAYYGRSKPKKKMPNKLYTFSFSFSYDVMLEYLNQNNIYQNILKNENTFKK